jgi:F-box and WD-40 domain protein CDC4
MEDATNTTHVADPPAHLSFPVHGSFVITCLVFSQGRIICASDDASINVYSPVTGQILHSLQGHKGGVWALAVSRDILVSSSTDQTIRIWNLPSGMCTHIFGGHTGTVRCLTIVKPEWIDRMGDDGATVREKWPKRSMIVSGSRDNSLRVWDLPREGDTEFRYHVSYTRFLRDSNSCIFRTKGMSMITLTTDITYKVTAAIYVLYPLVVARRCLAATIPWCEFGT